MKQNLFRTIGIAIIIASFLYALSSKIDKTKNNEDEADHPEMFTQYMKDITTHIGQNTSEYSMNYKVKEYKKAQRRFKRAQVQNDSLNWVLRGPANVGGRTRAIIVDPDDSLNNTWIASAATGGIWRTKDGGKNWTNLSNDLPNLSVNAMAMASSNHDVIYAGTGESFPGGTYLKGNGVWKSLDRGNTWTQLSATASDENFAYINRIIINPSNENIVLVATETGIFKSTDGGTTWSQKFSSNFGVEDLDRDPTDFNILFASEHNVGVLRSTDAGENWTLSSEGITSGSRFELAVSPVNHNNVFVSANVSTTESHVYFSSDNGLNWSRFNSDQNFLGGQGNYDNTIAAHPYNADEVFVGGVDLWKLKFSGKSKESAPMIKNVYTVNTDFLTFINFGGEYLGGGMSLKDGTDLVNGDTVAIEIRFGKGLSQKAHRFVVPANSTSGVDASKYFYKDYVDVPFQVWDMTHNRQLMVSFRDQERDGKFNLYPRTGDAYGELDREYIFINSVAYNASAPDSHITKNGGHLYKSLYMFWPVLSDGFTWDTNNLPDSKIVVDYGTIKQITGVKTSIADAYGNYNGPNNYQQGAGFGKSSIPGIHPDHHCIKIIPTGNGNFKWIDGNDGGLAVSDDNGVTLDQIPTNYITTQFYGVAKNPEANEYIGGMQDNGTWQARTAIEATSKSYYLFRIGGDGFECLWNTKDPNLMLGSVYNNQISRSTNKGLTWDDVTGIKKDDGPFVTKLSASKEKPDMVFAIGGEGVYKSIDFGKTWTMKPIETNWTVDTASTSSHNVEVSLSNGNIVWAGAGMAKDAGYQIQLSTNEGESFTPVNDYTTVKMNAFISGIATHPSEDSTAYLLFSLAKSPKILRTKDLGKTWEDISGFGTNTQSSNGFPDVVVHCLLVMPQNPNIIWVGTDIGLFESTNNGESWHIAQNGLPPVSIYDMLISGDQIVVATHGRGIWTLDIPEINNAPYINTFTQKDGNNLNVNTTLNVAYDSIQLLIDYKLYTTLQLPTTGETNIDVTVDSEGRHWSKLIAYLNGTAIRSNTVDINFGTNSIVSNDNISNKLIIYPNPARTYFTFEMSRKFKNMNIEILNLQGQRIFHSKKINTGINTININLKNGLYFVNIHSEGQRFTQKLKVNN